MYGYWPRTVTVSLALTLAACPSWAQGWERRDASFVVGYGDKEIVFRSPGTLWSGVRGGAGVTTAFFLWHDSWVYERLESGTAATGPELGADGVLRQSGLWGTREQAEPLRYALALAPDSTGVRVRLEMEKTKALQLTAGVWCVHSLDRKAFTDGQRVYARPQAHAAVGRPISGVCEALLVELVRGQAVSFAGDGFREVRSRISDAWQGFEMALHGTDFPVGAKVAMSLRVQFESMPAEFPGQVQPQREPLQLGRVRGPSAAVARFDRIELDVDLRGTWDNPYDPDDIRLDALVTTASGRTYTQPGFFLVDQERQVRDGVEAMVPAGHGRWCVRLAATEEGDVHIRLLARDRTGSTGSDVGPFLVVPAKGPGFLRQSPVDPHYLRFDNGQGFVPIGHNLPIYHASGQLAGDAIRKMAAAGENYNRWWLSAAGLGIEWEEKLGWYRQSAAARLDQMLELARELGFYYMLCLDTHQDFREGGWSANPYNRSNGGPCAEVKNWFTDEAARQFYRKRLRYTVARWAYSPNVMCWEFGNEFEGWQDTDEATKIEWHKAMAAFLAELDPYGHLISTSWWGHAGPESCWQIPRMDIVQTHCYTNNDENVGPQVRRFCLKQWNDFQKPHIFGEFGIRSHSTTADKDPKGWALHNAFWSALCSGACGIPMPWWHENYIDPLDLYFHFTAIRNFTRGLPFGTSRWEQVAAEPCEYVRPPPVAPSRDAVVATVGTWGKPRVSEFRLAPDGSVNDPDSIHELLQGEGHRDLKNPPTFAVEFPAAGKFVLAVGRVSNRGLLRVWVDEVLACERTLPCGEGIGKEWVFRPQWNLWESVYDEDVVVEIPAGKHRIRVDNSGKDWMRIKRLTFTGCRVLDRPPVLVAAIRCPEVAIAWIQNLESSWFNHQAGKVAVVPPSRIVLPGFPDGEYRVEWWETWRGAPARAEQANAVGGRLTLLPGELATDTAAKIQPTR